MPQPAYTTGIRLPPDLRQTLDALAAAEGRSLGNLVRALLRSELERRGVRALANSCTAPTTAKMEVTQ